MGKCAKKFFLLILFCWLLEACNTPSTVPVVATATNTLTPILTPTPNLPDIQNTLTAIPIIDESSTPSTFDWIEGTEQYKLITIVDKGEANQIFLYSPEKQTQKTFKFANTVIPLAIEHMMDNCDLIVQTYTDKGHELVRVNQAGEVTQNIFLLEFDRADEQLFLPQLSKNGEYIAYVAFSGEFYYDTAQYQNIEILELGKNNQPIPITTLGGAWNLGGAWSADGTKIAYTDYDENKNLQVYIAEISDAKIEKKAIASLGMGGKAGPIAWSPNDEQIIMIVQDENNDYTSSVWVIPVSDDNKAVEISLPDGKIIVREPYWSADSSKVLFNIVSYENRDIEGFYWFDIKNNKLLHMLNLNAASNINPDVDSFGSMFPITTNLSKIIFHGGMLQWYLYDVVHQSIEKVPWLNQHNFGINLDIALFSDINAACAP